MSALSEFTLLRPWWLLLMALIPAWWLLAHRLRQSDGGWEPVIPRPILQRLRPNPRSGQHRSSRWPVVALITIMALALSGPSLRYSEHPLHQYQDNLVIVLDVSLSMLAEDLPPDRLTQAKRKIRDILSMREGTETALVAYAGDAHVVSPLSRDARVIESFLPALDPFMMPAYGGRADLGMARAVELLEQAGRGPGRILLITDGVRERWHEAMLDQLDTSDYPLSILAVGTEEGGAIPLADRGHLQEDGETVIVRTDVEPLEQLARTAGGEAIRITTGDRDLETLRIAASNGLTAASEKSERSVLRRSDDGIWLMVLVIPTLLLVRRHGHLSAVVLTAAMVGWHPSAEASLWLTPDQRGARALEHDPAKAAEHFEDPEWAAVAKYRDGQYQQAAELWGMLDSPKARYNEGNALAFAGDLQAAIDAYDQALERNPDFSEARENRQRLLELMQDQRQERGAEGEPQSEPTPEADPDPSPDSEPEPGIGPNVAQDEAAIVPEPSEDETASQTDKKQPSASWDRADRHEQWLQQIPDNPASLLQRKFQHEHRQRSSDPTETDELW